MESRKSPVFPQALEIISLNAAKFEGRATDMGSLAVAGEPTPWWSMLTG
ncbi:MAG: hypothetical protein ABI178_04655 [Rhodanobacter sp.]